MARFFARFLALSLAAVMLIAALAVLIHIRPASPAGWGVLGLLCLGAFVGPALVYRALMRATAPPTHAGLSEGAGIAVGIGADTARRRSEDPDMDDGIDLD